MVALNNRNMLRQRTVFDVQRKLEQNGYRTNLALALAEQVSEHDLASLPVDTIVQGVLRRPPLYLFEKFLVDQGIIGFTRQIALVIENIEAVTGRKISEGI